MIDDAREAPADQPVVKAEDEFKAMASVASAIDGLGDVAARRRVMAWAADRYGITLEGAPGRRTAGDRAAVGAAGLDQPHEYADFAEMYHAAGPRTDRQRLLVAGYWLQVRQNEQNLHADNVNEILTPLGQRIDRVRDVLPGLLAGRPALMIRAGKGKGVRGRVLFRLTTAGIGAVDAALAAGEFDDGGE